jgi:hypothetical protein
MGAGSSLVLANDTGEPTYWSNAAKKEGSFLGSRMAHAKNNYCKYRLKAINGRYRVASGTNPTYALKK